MNFKYKIALLLGILFLLILTGCSDLDISSQANNPKDIPAKIYKGESELFDHQDEITTRAIQNKDPAICKQLPFEGGYYVESNRALEGDSYYPHSMYYICLKKYSEELDSLEACNIIDDEIDDDNHYKSSLCIRNIAEIKGDESICDMVKNHSAKTTCHAFVTGDSSHCYKLEKDEHDVSPIPRSVQFCIGDVVLRTKDHTPCLQIDGADYGEQWRIGLNECLSRAAYFLKIANKDFQSICNFMVEDETPFDTKQRCNDGSITDYSSVVL